MKGRRLSLTIRANFELDNIEFFKNQLVVFEDQKTIKSTLSNGLTMMLFSPDNSVIADFYKRLGEKNSHYKK